VTDFPFKEGGEKRPIAGGGGGETTGPVPGGRLASQGDVEVAKARTMILFEEKEGVQEKVLGGKSDLPIRRGLKPLFGKAQVKQQKRENCTRRGPEIGDLPSGNEQFFKPHTVLDNKAFPQSPYQE